MEHKDVERSSTLDKQIITFYVRFLWSGLFIFNAILYLIQCIKELELFGCMSGTSKRNQASNSSSYSQ